MFNDDWMRERGFLEEPITKAEDVIKDHIDKPVVVQKELNLCIERMRKYKISQIPVIDTRFCRFA
jgi:cystathionine beta-synthase